MSRAKIFIPRPCVQNPHIAFEATGMFACSTRKRLPPIRFIFPLILVCISGLSSQPVWSQIRKVEIQELNAPEIKKIQRAVKERIQLEVQAVAKEDEEEKEADTNELNGVNLIWREALTTRPDNLDPQVSYTARDAAFIMRCYEQLLGYSYLDRPLKITPELAAEVPEPEIKRDEAGKVTEVRYRFTLQEGVHFVDDACFKGSTGRELVADDFLFTFQRIADPETACPVYDVFRRIRGMEDFRERLDKIRKQRAQKVQDRHAPGEQEPIKIRDLYTQAGDLEGVVIKGKYELEIVLDAPYPRMLHWLTTPFASAIPHEAVEKTKKPFDEVPVGTGPFQFTSTNAAPGFVMQRAPNWWGLDPKRRTPANRFALEAPTEEDWERGFWKHRFAGKLIPQMEQIQYVPVSSEDDALQKFLAGEMDMLEISNAQYNRLVNTAGELPENYREQGIRLIEKLETDVSYIGFNMNSDRLGAPTTFRNLELQADREEELAKRRKLRQALSLAFDAEGLKTVFDEQFLKAESPVPPGLYGYDANYTNRFRQFDPRQAEARRLLAEAGYPDGVDPETGKALRLNFPVTTTDPHTRMRFRFMCNMWKQIGVDVQMRGDADNVDEFHLFQYGWLMDFPDPENFLFLFYGPNSRKYLAENPGMCFFENKKFDQLFERAQVLENGKERLKLIHQMRDLIEEECPWIPVQHNRRFYLLHAWVEHPKLHPVTGYDLNYRRFNPRQRALFLKNWRSDEAPSDSDK